MSANKDRIQFISTARVIGILLVVFGHSFPFDVPLPSFLYHIQLFIYRFHMPLFVFISGYLIAFNKNSMRNYILRRSKRLLIPYFSLSLIAFVPKVLIQSLLNDSAELSLTYLIRSELIPRDNVWGHFWYLPVVFFLGILGKYLVVFSKNKKWPIIVSLVIAFVVLFMPQTTDWFALEDIRNIAFYFLFGLFVALYYHNADFFASHLWMIALPTSVAVFLLCNNTFSYVLTACMMIAFICHLSVRIKNVSGFARLLDASSYTIFLLSWPVQAVTEVILNKLLHFPPMLTFAAMFFLGLLVPILVYVSITWLDKRFRIKWIKVLVGM